MNFDPLHITFGLYIAAMIGIGIVTYFKTANYGEYILGGRGLGSWVTAISAQAADFSGWILMGLPGAAYASGLGKTSIYICIFTAIGAMMLVLAFAVLLTINLIQAWSRRRFGYGA